MTGAFGGQTNVGRSMFSTIEQRVKHGLAGRVPSWLGTQQLTLATLPLSAALLACGALASRWRGCWLIAAVVIVVQYLTDLVDGEVGRRRSTGLVRWGFYTDHLLDFVFLSIGLVGYCLGVPEVPLALSLGFMLIVQTLIVSTYLEFGVTGVARYKHFRVGPTELRISMIVADLALYLTGTRWLVVAAPYLVGGFAVLLLAWTYRGQRTARRIDAVE
ncbi:CDP-alcohol phosphatidyltransferase family protein [Actinoplanes sp. L3-i22]|uniref:CDP-alcohol phosphatidyltransferase family protein n=1 Tax=Actinoplanes sp. L3-i22 TaxID=2836373 RepID=UPI001C84506A|nr:CDP-alcohol phosphatidyltransferase family protein [Actinoplanes sp. L3-i22]